MKKFGMTLLLFFIMMYSCFIFDLLEYAGDFPQQVILVKNADLVVRELQLHVQLRVAGVEHIGDERQAVQVTLMDDVVVLVRQLDTLLLRA